MNNTNNRSKKTSKLQLRKVTLLDLGRVAGGVSNTACVPYSYCKNCTTEYCPAPRD